MLRLFWLVSGLFHSALEAVWRLLLRSPIDNATWTVVFPLRCYEDDFDRGMEPPCHSIQLVVEHGIRRWHVRIVLAHGDADASELPARKKALQDLCRAIKFSSLPLLDNTVTELFISTSEHHTASKLQLHHCSNIKNLDDFWFTTREDPTRIRYPSYTGAPETRQVGLADLTIDSSKKSLGPAVNRAEIKSEPGQIYILKQVERELYQPSDSLALEKELRVLEQIGGENNIVRCIAAVISSDPYYTTAGSQEEVPRVLRGILLEYHCNGTLTEALHSREATTPWQRWGAQLCTAVSALHRHDLTHMDIKPSNIVLDKDDNLVLIDVGGAGGVSHEWLSPKMKGELEPLLMNLQDRKENDIWAIGKILSLMAHDRGQPDSQQSLQDLAERAMRNPEQISLSELASDLMSNR